MTRTPRRVALLIETSRKYGRALLHGIFRYLREHGPWSLYFQPWGLGEPFPPWLRRWDGDGILVRADSRELANLVARKGIPAIELRWTFTDLGLPAVGIDNRQIVQLAFDHLRALGLRQFAFCGLAPGRNRWADYRQQTFEELARADGFPCWSFRPRSVGRGDSWEREQKQIAEWVKQLPKPVGLMACNDDRGLQVLDACRWAGVRVPQDLAVIGVDNDEFLCNLASPPMSSVDVGADNAGYHAAAQLDRLMAGKPLAEHRVFLPPRGVVVRQSTDMIAIEDPELAEAVRFLRRHACDGIRVDDVLARVPLSYSTFQRRFKQFFGRSPKQEMIRLQIERARELLSQTDLSLAEVARRCGYPHLKDLCRAFRTRLGTTPATYRDQYAQPRSPLN
ncbi:MAG TPA: DNA-binding transcriptional regulator [Gemmataceae bacterium]|nr:DNA-binding transcriptional regulator [Gemmataceae bacterium]